MSGRTAAAAAPGIAAGRRPTLLGPARLVLRLAARDLRRRPAAAALLLAAIAAATTTLAVALAVRAAGQAPWERTWRATAGPDVVVTTAGRAGVASLPGLAHAPGVTAVAGPFPLLFLDLGSGGRQVLAVFQGRDVEPAAVDRPLVTSGGWIRDGAVVVERSFADAEAIGVGDTVTIADRRFTVAGTAVTTAWEPYPTRVPGLVWVTRADARRLAPAARNRTLSLLALRLTDSAAAPAFAGAHNVEGLNLEAWQQIRDDVTADLRTIRIVLLTGSALLALLAIASVAVLVGGRLAAQTRRVGLLKAVGASPRLVAAVLLAEHVLLALVAAALGLVGAVLAVPLLAKPSSGMLGSADVVPLTRGTVAVVVLVAVATIAVATLPPALRGVRSSTMRALASSARPPRRSARVLALSAAMPVPVLLGMRLAARQPRRGALATVSIALTVTTVVATMAMNHAFAVEHLQFPGDDVHRDQLRHIVYLFSVPLLLLATANTVLLAWATALDNAGASALARALGATPRQVAAGLTIAQLLPALVAALLGIPAGLALFRGVNAAVGGGPPPGGGVPLPWLLAVVPATLIATAVITIVPSRHGARQPVAAALRHE